MKRKYLLQFEFKTKLGDVYFFPVFALAEDNEAAINISTTFIAALEQHYINIKSYEPKLVIEGVNSDFIQDYIKQRMLGRVEILDTSIWKFKTISTIPHLNFDQHIELIESENLLSEGNIAVIVGQYKFPVRLLIKNSFINFTEYLLINVVDPDDIPIDEDIVIRLTERQQKFVTINLLTESQWLSANYKDFIYRVERHSADMDRHIHISHEKHASNKNMQVSWNQTDGSIHDKKSFNHNFSGMNKAKEIARNVLGLSSEITLSESIVTTMLLKESVSQISDNGFIYLELAI